MMPEIEPALTPEEWDKYRPYLSGELPLGPQLDALEARDRRDATAALALHGQPFGFTWEMVDAIRELVRVAAEEDGGHPDDELTRAAADRISALLPPREQT